MTTLSLATLIETRNLRQVLSAVSAMALGGLLILTVGFAPMDTVHNTAHDTRHSANFPCH